VSAESRRLAVELYLAGEKVSYITSVVTGASGFNRLYRWLDEAGVPRRGSGRQAVDRAQVAKLLQSGMPARQVAIRLGCHYSTIRKIRAQLAASR
jgi:DNA invertase Pin-like site-specific DNA recombinase